MAVAFVESAEPPVGEPEQRQLGISGRSPWALAGRRLWSNKLAIAASALFLLIVVISFAAPIYAHFIAHTNPFVNNLNGSTIINGKRVPLMQQGGGILKLGET